MSANTQHKTPPSVSAAQNDELLTITLHIEGGQVNKAHFRQAAAFVSRYQFQGEIRRFITKYTDWQTVYDPIKKTDYMPIAFAEAFLRHIIPDVVVKKVIGKPPL